MSLLRHVIVVYLLTWQASVLGDFEPFSAAEYQARVQRAQQRMKEEDLGAILLTMELNHYYFSGVKSEFWQSPTRPYYLVIPSSGPLTAVVPSISGILYEAHSEVVGSVHTWPAPQPDDDGISLLEDALRRALQQSGGRRLVGAELGWEFHLRMPPSDFKRLEKLLEDAATFVDATLLIKRLRAVKSEAEIEVMRTACQLQSKAITNIPVHGGMTEKEAARTARVELIKAGANNVPYVACRSGPGGYTDMVGAASSKVLHDGDVLIIDSGTTVDGYFCDFNRNWYIGKQTEGQSQELRSIQERLYRAVEAGIREARPGRTTADLFHAMAAELPDTGSSVGRFGHGVGLAITEWPSILPAAAGQNVTLEAGMVMALEPSAAFGDHGAFLAHEEDVVVSEEGGKLLSVRAPRLMPSLPGAPADSSGEL